jgi:hypothetical protein
VAPFGPSFGTPVTLHFTVRDALTGQVVQANVDIPGIASGPSPDVGPCTFDASALYLTSSQDRSTRGSDRLICTIYRGSHYPVATVTAVGYAPAVVALGPEAPRSDLPKPACITIPANVPVDFFTELEEYLIIHGGDPLPDHSPIAGLGPKPWQAVRTSAIRWQKARHSAMQKLRHHGDAIVTEIPGRIIQTRR